MRADGDGAASGPGREDQARADGEQDGQVLSGAAGGRRGGVPDVPAGDRERERDHGDVRGRAAGRRAGVPGEGDGGVFGGSARVGVHSDELREDVRGEVRRGREEDDGEAVGRELLRPGDEEVDEQEHGVGDVPARVRAVRVQPDQAGDQHLHERPEGQAVADAGEAGMRAEGGREGAGGEGADEEDDAGVAAGGERAAGDDDLPPAVAGDGAEVQGGEPVRGAAGRHVRERDQELRPERAADAVRVEDDSGVGQGPVLRVRACVRGEGGDGDEGADHGSELRAGAEEGPVHEDGAEDGDLDGEEAGVGGGRAVREHGGDGGAGPVHHEERDADGRKGCGRAPDQGDEVLGVAGGAGGGAVQARVGSAEAGGGAEAAGEVGPDGVVHDRGERGAHHRGRGGAASGDLPEGSAGGLHGRRRDRGVGPGGVVPGDGAGQVGADGDEQVAEQAQPAVLRGAAAGGGAAGGDRRRADRAAGRPEGAEPDSGAGVRVGQGPGEEDLVLRAGDDGAEHGGGHVQGSAVPERDQGLGGGGVPVGDEGGGVGGGEHARDRVRGVRRGAAHGRDPSRRRADHPDGAARDVRGAADGQAAAAGAGVPGGDPGAGGRAGRHLRGAEPEAWARVRGGAEAGDAAVQHQGVPAGDRVVRVLGNVACCDVGTGVPAVRVRPLGDVEQRPDGTRVSGGRYRAGHQEAEGAEGADDPVVGVRGQVVRLRWLGDFFEFFGFLGLATFQRSVLRSMGNRPWQSFQDGSSQV